MFSIGCVSTRDILNRVTEFDILSFYLNIKKIPIVIRSPLRKDKTPSFGLYTSDGKRVYYKDFATRDRGGTFDLMMKIWGLKLGETCRKIFTELCVKKVPICNTKVSITKRNNNTDDETHTPSTNKLEVVFREWAKHDYEFWESFGISKEWLEYAEVYPISYKIITKNGDKLVYKADKYAYTFIERKDGDVTYKIYQPFNKSGYKWSSNINRSVWSLWTKIPEKGKYLVIASSLKDCLNIWANLNIPAVCLQGEGYLPKQQVMEQLKDRYENIIVFYDNDYKNAENPGRKDSIALAEKYSLNRVEIPEEYQVKDPSDCFKKYGREKYLEIMREIFKKQLFLNHN